jgi:hypothetical protein
VLAPQEKEARSKKQEASEKMPTFFVIPAAESASIKPI